MFDKHNFLTLKQDYESVVANIRSSNGLYTWLIKFEELILDLLCKEQPAHENKSCNETSNNKTTKSLLEIIASIEAMILELADPIIALNKYKEAIDTYIPNTKFRFDEKCLNNAKTLLQSFETILNSCKKKISLKEFKNFEKFFKEKIIYNTIKLKTNNNYKEFICGSPDTQELIEIINAILQGLGVALPTNCNKDNNQYDSLSDLIIYSYNVNLIIEQILNCKDDYFFNFNNKIFYTKLLKLFQENKGFLKGTELLIKQYGEIDKYLEEDPDFLLNFEKWYDNKLMRLYTKIAVNFEENPSFLLNFEKWHKDKNLIEADEKLRELYETIAANVEENPSFLTNVEKWYRNEKNLDFLLRVTTKCPTTNKLLKNDINLIKYKKIAKYCEKNPDFLKNFTEEELKQTLKESHVMYTNLKQILEEKARFYTRSPHKIIHI